MLKNDKLFLKLLLIPSSIVCLLLYLVIMHADLFHWVNIEQLRSFTPDIFMPINRDNLYNEAVLAGTVYFIAILFIPLYCFLLFVFKTIFNRNEMSKRLSYTLYEQQGKYGYIKFFFMFIFFFVCIFDYIKSSIHNHTSSSYVTFSFIKAYPKRYLLMDFFSLYVVSVLTAFLLYLVISPLFFNTKKKSNSIN